MKKMFFALMLVLAFTGAVYPQAQSGTIVGTVTDQAGAVIPGANVRLVNEGAQFTRVVVTNANGQIFLSHIFLSGDGCYQGEASTLCASRLRLCLSRD